MATRRPLTLSDAGSTQEMPSGDLLPGDVVAPAWAPSTPYTVGVLVWQDGKLYRRRTAGTSGTTFDPTAWDLVSADPDAWLGVVASGLDIIVSTAPAATNVTHYMRVTRGTAMMISKLAVSVLVSGGNIALGVHRNTGTGTAATPGERVASTGSVAAATAGFPVLTLDAPVLVAPGDWFSLAADNSTARFGGSGAGTANAIGDNLVRQQSTYPVPQTPSGLSSGTRRFSVYGIA